MNPWQVPFLTNSDFPDPNRALTEPNGLLAIGANLHSSTLLKAYRMGIFPWYESQPIMWWSPDPRMVLWLQDFHVSKSLQRRLKKHDFTILHDRHFEQVVEACSCPRFYEKGSDFNTWITREMKTAYCELFNLGYAHCVEVWFNQRLVGGIYGISLGRLFFAESMFSQMPNGSKIALYYLVEFLLRNHFKFIDCQVWSQHLENLGAKTIPRKQFLALLTENNKLCNINIPWDAELNQF